MWRLNLVRGGGSGFPFSRHLPSPEPCRLYGIGVNHMISNYLLDLDDQEKSRSRPHSPTAQEGLLFVEPALSRPGRVIPFGPVDDVQRALPYVYSHCRGRVQFANFETAALSLLWVQGPEEGMGAERPALCSMSA